MALLPPLKRFLQEDFTDQPWISRLLTPLNLFLTTVYSSLNNGLTINENTLGQIKTISVNGATPTAQFRWNFQTKPVGVLVISTVQSSGAASVITNAVTCDWSFSQGLVNINNVTGLDVAKTYYITFYVIGG